MGDVMLDDQLIQECQQEQQAILGYSDTRDVVARKITDLIADHPDLRRDQVVGHVGNMGAPK